MSKTDQRLADLGNVQILLLFVVCFGVFVRKLEAQQGAPGDLFHGVAFSFAMVLLGTAVLIWAITKRDFRRRRGIRHGWFVGRDVFVSLRQAPQTIRVAAAASMRPNPPRWLPRSTGWLPHRS